MDNSIARMAYRPREAAEVLGISIPTLYQWMMRADFPSIKVGGCTLIPVHKLEQWLSEQIDASVARNNGMD